MFNIKTLVAVAALAAAGAASATVLGPVGTTAGGEMSFTVFSATAEASFIFDTGLMLADFRAASTAATGTSPYSLSYNLSANTEFQSFLSLVASTGATDVGFMFFGGDNSGNGVNDRTLITTVSGDASVITNGNMVDSLNAIANNYLTAGVNQNTRFQGAANANASGTFITGQGKGYVLESLGTDFTANFQAIDGALGSSVDVYDFVRSSTSSGGDAIETKIGAASLKLNAAGQYVLGFTTPVETVVVPSVPEPESYGLALVGLMLAGAVARRRAAK